MVAWSWMTTEPSYRYSLTLDENGEPDPYGPIKFDVDGTINPDDWEDSQVTEELQYTRKAGLLFFVAGDPWIAFVIGGPLE
eukprot:symbB.v1.2.033207.t1/scaffold4011.1/size46447/4